MCLCLNRLHSRQDFFEMGNNSLRAYFKQECAVLDCQIWNAIFTPPEGLSGRNMQAPSNTADLPTSILLSMRT